MFLDAEDVDFGDLPLTACGTVSSDYYLNVTGQRETSYGWYPASHNEAFRLGLPLVCMGKSVNYRYCCCADIEQTLFLILIMIFPYPALGPMVLGIGAFLVVHAEFQLSLVGVLRGLGLPESVYWMSWLLPFTVISVVNALLAAGTAKLMPIHAYEHTYFVGIFLSFFFLDLAIVACSLFLAAFCGTTRRLAAWLILLIMVAPWVPYMVETFSSAFISSYEMEEGPDLTPVGFFWLNGNTVRSSSQ